MKGRKSKDSVEDGIRTRSTTRFKIDEIKVTDNELNGNDDRQDRSVEMLSDEDEDSPTSP